MVRVLLIWLAVKWRGDSIGNLISGRWRTFGSFFRDLGLAVGFLIVVVPLVGIIAYLLGGDPDVANIIPKTVFKLIFWLGLAVTAGFCEEVIFRGYLSRQFRAWTGNLVFAILLQGVLFGLAHGYYGRVMVAITVQGWLLGLLRLLAQKLASWNGGPRPARWYWRPRGLLLMKARSDFQVQVRPNHDVVPNGYRRVNSSSMTELSESYFSLGVSRRRSTWSS
jgi:hypothetical protein